ncbi:MAG TPA: CoA ester lyase [Chloroflexota bacterium]|jgi:citrate lyase subunit beta/citryl-CoA lyase|nr:CoA ester lyase [Chloroflexota bacterium]
MEPLRTLLFVPANRQRLLDKAPTLGADALLLDLEDAVPLAEKEAARRMAQAYLPTITGQPVWVRVNAVASGELAADLDALVGVRGLAGIVLPKPEAPAEVLELDRLLRAREAVRGLAPGSVPVILQIESAAGVLFAYPLATAAARVVSVCFGGAEDGDLQSDLGCGWSIEGPELLYARQHTLLAARAARLAWPLDGVFANVRDADGFARDTQLSRRLGYRGRTVIHPSQIAPANQLYSPSPAEVAYYRRVLEAFDAAVAQGTASTTVDGKLVDYAMAERARRVLALAARLGVTG